MEIIGKIKQVCDLIEGSTAAGDWCKKDVVITTTGDEPRDIAVTFFGARRVDKLRELKEGDMVQCNATVKSRTNDGSKWFTTVDGQSIALLQRQPLQGALNLEEEPPY